MRLATCFVLAHHWDVEVEEDSFLFRWSVARRAKRKQNRGVDPPGTTACASCAAFFGSGTTPTDLPEEKVGKSMKRQRKVAYRFCQLIDPGI
jgi:hypothetical protein